MPSHRTPSLKTLRTLPGVDTGKAVALKRLLTACRADLESHPAAGELLARWCWHAPATPHLRLTCLDAELGTYGVEAFRTDRGELVEYLNAGDTYAPTIVRFRGTYRVACWGDIAERHGAQ